MKEPKSFSPPKGIHGFSTCIYDSGGTGSVQLGTAEFQSPEGDSWFFYPQSNKRSSAWQSGFQSPEGDSWFFYTHATQARRSDQARFSPPKGIHGFSTAISPPK